MKLTKMQTKDPFGKALIAQLISHDISVIEFASEMSVSSSAVHKWIYGKSYPSLPDVVRIAKFFSVGLADMWREDDI